MICGRNDWDELLEEARVRAILEGREQAPAPLVREMKLADYGASIVFSLDELLGRK